MSTEIANPEEKWKISPEMDEIITSYLQTASIMETARNLGIPKEKVSYYLSKPEAKRLVDTVMLEQTYLSRHNLQRILSDIMEEKLEEMRESEMTTSKDILDVIALAHKMNSDNAKITAENEKVNPPTNQTNVQINAGMGDNYENLLHKLMGTK